MSTSPFFYFDNFDFDPAALTTFVESIPKNDWFGPSSWKQKVNALLEPNNQDQMLPATDDSHVKWWLAMGKFTDFTKCDEINRIAKYFTIDDQPLFRGMAIKKTQKHFAQPFNPLMQNKETDTALGIVRTFDIVIPIKGGFKENPVEALDTISNTIYRTQPTGKAYMLRTNPEWHYRWEETVEDFRYTLHLRGAMPTTYEMVKDIYSA